MRLIFSNAQQYTSKTYQSAAITAIRGRWLTNEPSTRWTTMATVEQQLHEVESSEAVDQDRISELRDFYRVRISQIDEL
jgi:exodeoxyribonuclease I